MDLAKSVADGKAHTLKAVFGRETAVSIDIEADATIIWAFLTNAPDYPRWNSTIVYIDGLIAKGEKVKLVSKLDPKRTFKLKVMEAEAGRKLVWGDAMGKRTYTLTPKSGGIITFTMHEKIGGPLFPLFAKMIPSFDESFEQFTADLKREAEIIMNAK